MLQTPCKPLLQTLSKTFSKPSANHCFKLLDKPCPNPLEPLEGLTFSALKQKASGVNTIKGLLCKPTFYIQIKGFPRNITKHTKRNMFRPFNKPLRKTFLFPFPLEGGRGVNTIQAFALRKVTASLPLPVVLSFRPSQSKQVPA